MTAKRRKSKRGWISSPILSLVLLTALVVGGVVLGVQGFLPGLTGIMPTPAPTAAASGEDLRVYFLPAGKADAHLLLCGEESLLIDGGTGETQEALVRYLGRMGVTRLTYLIATHPHEDHIGGLDAVLAEVGADTVYLSYSEHTTRAYEDLLLAIEDNGAPALVPAAGDSFALGEAQCVFLTPLRTDYSDLNDTSLVLQVTLGDVTFLFTGDIETAAERDLVNAYAQGLQSDVLKVPHHGSNTSSGKDFLAAVNPEYGVIPCGTEENGEGPAAKVLTRLRNIGAQIYTTSGGIVSCTTDGVAIRFTEGSGFLD